MAMNGSNLPNADIRVGSFFPCPALFTAENRCPVLCEEGFIEERHVGNFKGFTRVRHFEAIALCVWLRECVMIQPWYSIIKRMLAYQNR